MKQKIRQVLAKCARTALNSLKRKLFTLLLKTWSLTFESRILKGSEFHFKLMWWKKDLKEDKTDGTLPKRIIWFERLFNRKFAVGNFNLSTNAFFSFVDILEEIGEWLQFNTLPNAEYFCLYSNQMMFWYWNENKQTLKPIHLFL